MNFPLTVRPLSCILLGLVLVLLLACGSSAPSDSLAHKQVRGQVVEVEERSITEVETLRLRDGDGRVWVFNTEGFIGFSPSHLREHQLFGQEVQVSYIERDRRLIATDITD